MDDPSCNTDWLQSCAQSNRECVVEQTEMVYWVKGPVELFRSLHILSLAAHSLDEIIRPRLLHHHHICPENFPIVFLDRKSTRLNSSHLVISYAVFCLKK